MRASADENPELFWGLRGGGGNFGIVTSFEFRLHPVGPTVLAGAVFYPGDQAARGRCAPGATRSATAPDELTTLVNLLTAPPAPFLPEEWHGKPLVAVVGCYAGAPTRRERALRPLRELGTPVADLFGPMPYVEMQQPARPAVGARRPQLHEGRLPARARRRRDRHAGRPARERHLAEDRDPRPPPGGAVARVAADATAFGERARPSC